MRNLVRIAMAASMLAQNQAQTPSEQPKPAGAAPAQTSQPAEQSPLLLRSNTRLVQISVVVHNRKGEPVADLKKEDFTLTEKGKPQTISVFSVESTGKLAAPPIKLPPHIFSNRLMERSGVPSSVTVILLDSLNTKWQDQVYAKKQ